MNFKSLREVELERKLAQLEYENARLRYLVHPWHWECNKPKMLDTANINIVPVYKVAVCSLHLRHDLRAREVYMRAHSKNGDFSLLYLVDNDSLLSKKDLAYVLGELHERTLHQLANFMEDEETLS